MHELLLFFACDVAFFSIFENFFMQACFFFHACLLFFPRQAFFLFQACVSVESAPAFCMQIQQNCLQCCYVSLVSCLLAPHSLCAPGAEPSHNFQNHNTMSKKRKSGALDDGALFQCKGCFKSFATGAKLMRHIGQTQCSHLFPAKLVQQLSSSRQASQAEDDIPSEEEFDTPGWLNDEDSHASDANAPAALEVTRNHVAPIVPFNHSLQIETSLLDILKDSGAPLWAFQRIMEWASNAHRSGYHFSPERGSYHSQIQYLEDTMKMWGLRPKSTLLMLEGHDNPAQCVHFDFKAHFESLINDPTINHPDNLVVNSTDPFLPYYPPDERLGEILTGSWYHHAVATMVGDQHKEFCCPIVISTDKTHISAESEYNSHPVFFTLAVFNRSTRNRAEAWRPLGYIHHPRKKKNQPPPKGDAKGASTRNTHQQLSVILQSLWEAQQPHSWTHKYELVLGDKKKIVKLLLPIGPILCDAQGGDELCGRILHYGAHAHRICRTCDAMPHNCGDPDVECNRVSMSELQKAVESNDEEALKILYSHRCNNAFFRMNFGNDPYGIMSMCNTETLHAAKNGFILHFLREQFTKFYQARGCKKIDQVSCWLSTLPRQSGAAQFRRLSFKDGITVITNTSAEDRLCILKTLLLVLVTKEGRQATVKKSKTTEDGVSRNVGVEGWRKLVHAVELMLTFVAWASSDKFWKVGNAQAEKIAEDSLKKMMQMLHELAPRAAGQGWNITKVHEIKHIALDISRFGTPSNTNTGPTEHHHILHAKRPAKTCRKERTSFDMSVANRYIDHIIINRCSRLFSCDGSSNAKWRGNDSTETGGASESEVKSSRGKLKFKRATNNTSNLVIRTQKWKTKSQAKVQLDERVMECIGNWAGESGLAPGEQIVVRAFTEYRRFGETFRAHPNYRSDGPWLDWVYIQWEEPLGSIPACIQTFIESKGKRFAVVHSATATPVGHSVLTRLCSMECREDGLPILHVVSCASIKHHTYIIPQSRDPNDPSRVELIPDDLWGTKFTTASKFEDAAHASDWDESSDSGSET